MCTALTNCQDQLQTYDCMHNPQHPQQQAFLDLYVSQWPAQKHIFIANGVCKKVEWSQDI